MILSCNHIVKSYVVDQILKDISLVINEHDKIALVGVNGAGKTTLFKILTGELQADSGDVIIANGKSIGYLRQNALSESNHSLIDEVYHSNEELIHMKKELSQIEDKLHLHSNDLKILEQLNKTYDTLRIRFEAMDGYAYDSLVRGVLSGLGFTKDDFNKPVNQLSGGQKTRVALAKELIRKPDILMLDEPTNHLDIESVAWLETYLKNYNGTLLVISHDRFFLDVIANRTLEIELGKVYEYNGNYSMYVKQKEKNRLIMQKHYEQQQKEIKHQEEVITKLRSFNREKSIKRAESREKLLNKVERLDKPMEVHADMNLRLKPRNESGNDVLIVHDLKKAFDHIHLFEHLSLHIKKGEHVALIGDNGTGKSTLFKIINQVVEPDEGTVTIGSRVKIGYYDQEHQLLNPDNTLIEEIASAYPTLDNGQIRNILASYLFKGDDAFKKVSALSGGEKGRLTLVKLMLSEANFLILDEPTNHLDIVSKTILEEALIGYEGTLLVISHDRYFINKVATRIIHLNQGHLDSYLGNYDDFKAKQAHIDTTQTASLTATNSTIQATDTSLNKMTWMEEKAYKAEKRKLENQFEAIEKQIHELETEIEDLENQLLDEAVYTDHVKASTIATQKAQLEATLTTSYEEWETVSHKLEAYPDL